MLQSDPDQWPSCAWSCWTLFYYLQTAAATCSSEVAPLRTGAGWHNFLQIPGSEQGNKIGVQDNTKKEPYGA